jgi:hypothetical protein
MPWRTSDCIEKAGLNGRVKRLSVEPNYPEFADSIGTDGFGIDAMESQKG